ncbi:helix-turn-helix domain-containing protein [Paenibacillus oleatilyticus]|uniref:helix-turn-helix domain-containing protein n=1 Tax=Paenibacillus oleatilyticus TaxID=2594886 RepID=UPI001C1FCBA5|nr:helix-turn-helix transcriptional regulator [Paenibacillus oleatilyticus]MBU7315650.1 helix-turn-helix domain-containing protein [Paenibacillus oleatilyticus]
MSVLAERLRHLRENKGWSQTYVAERLGIKRSSTYANWEYGIREPDTETLVKLAQIFEVTTDYLTGASDHVQFPPLDELDRKLFQAIRSLNNEDKEYVLGFIQRIKNK